MATPVQLSDGQTVWYDATGGGWYDAYGNEVTPNAEMRQYGETLNRQLTSYRNQPITGGQTNPSYGADRPSYTLDPITGWPTYETTPARSGYDDYYRNNPGESYVWNPNTGQYELSGQQSEPTPIDIPPVESNPATVVDPTTGQVLPNYQFSTRTPDTDFSNANPTEQAEQNRMAARAWGQAMDQGLLDYSNWQEALEGGLLDQLMYGPGGYGNILTGSGGFTDAETQNLLQEWMLRGAMASPDELNDLGFTEDEQAAIIGDAYHAQDLFAGQAPWLEGLTNEAAARQIQAISGLAPGLQQSVATAERARMDPTYYPYADKALTDLNESLYSFTDPSFLSMRSGYAADQDAITGDVQNRARGYLGDQLGLSGEFLGDFAFTDQDMQNIRDQAAFRVQQGRQAQIDELQRQAAASGNVNPLALEAAKDRLGYTGMQEANRAQLDAEIAAKQLQLNTALAREQERLGSEQYRSNLGIGTEMNLSQQELDELYRQEQMRLAAEQEMSRLGIGASQGLADTRLQQLNTGEAMRQAAERDIANRQADAAAQQAQTQLAAEQAIADQMWRMGQYNVGQSTDLARYGEAESARRHSDLAQMQNTQDQARLATRYGQALDTSTALSNRYGGVYGQKKKEEEEGRGFLTGMHGRAQEAGSRARGQRLQAGATQFGAINQPTMGLLGQPTTFDRIMQGITGGLSALFGTAGVRG